MGFCFGFFIKGNITSRLGGGGEGGMKISVHKKVIQWYFDACAHSIAELPVAKIFFAGAGAELMVGSVSYVWNKKSCFQNDSPKIIDSLSIEF